ncbi:hypothetical protein QE152_g27386 [Popillia japonica]|uniref:Integrase catalytic domain-containing protein n=1 Tax=Popillia japonica TaxID=7064 RepID=A0AAW1JSQ8_POPJA
MAEAGENVSSVSTPITVGEFDEFQQNAQRENREHGQNTESMNMSNMLQVRLCRQLNLSIREIKEQILVGLWSKDLCNTMITREHGDLDELLNDILLGERIHTSRQSRIKDTRVEFNKHTPSDTGKKTTVQNMQRNEQKEAVRNTKSEPTIRKIEEFIERFGAPERMVTDRGTCFTSRKFEILCQQYGIKHTLNSSRHPQANGLVERVNAVLLPMLQIATSEDDDTRWDVHLKKIERDLNTSVNKSTGKSAFELLYGYIPRFKDVMRTDRIESATQIKRR